jgi:hypothetical protein
MPQIRSTEGLEDICGLVLDRPYFRRDAVATGRRWRLPLLFGLVVGGYLSAALGGGWHLQGTFGLPPIKASAAAK